MDALRRRPVAPRVTRIPSGMATPNDNLLRTYAWVCANDGRLSGTQSRVVKAGIRSGFFEIAGGLAS